MAFLDEYIQEHEAWSGKPFRYDDHREISTLLTRVLEATDFPRTHEAPYRAMQAVIGLAEHIQGDARRRAALLRGVDHFCARVKPYI